MNKIISDEKELKEFASEIINYSKEIKVFIFNGDLGTGKTTLIKQLCVTLGVVGQTSSPTYSIVNEYLYPKGKIYHIDLYRLDTVAEAFEVGLEDYLYSNNYCFIEWPKIAKELLPNDYIEINIEKIAENGRSFSIKKIQS